MGRRGFGSPTYRNLIRSLLWLVEPRGFGERHDAVVLKGPDAPLAVALFYQHVGIDGLAG